MLSKISIAFAKNVCEKSFRFIQLRSFINFIPIVTALTFS